VLVRGITVGVPRTDRMTIILTLDGKTFNAHPGDSLSSSPASSTSLPSRHTTGSSFAAELQCNDLSAAPQRRNPVSNRRST
jgi:membrane-associated phospholipid phosphatase